MKIVFRLEEPLVFLCFCFQAQSASKKIWTQKFTKKPFSPEKMGKLSSFHHLRQLFPLEIGNFCLPLPHKSQFLV
jgi:hypothetical protein